ncbi:uncharacterized protein K452DRAFT_257450 [Aplosporella prunicola CBS 121167]|uniref:CST complex subunit Stn1 N-terminal domain-containing protein n=1 Tax=Aplosporella prunicola CBS 121167 TaxID=1176127 RepID=A0A6A6B0F9_9PEZI|nr:uncharacterized protein K452DRAFT_257450 [Aplosporella prunicola CBS 121167]KAF2137669.1 hypothetical protein K452DRAFT_257450 [Aplosporella prunicola CBS 121167]
MSSGKSLRFYPSRFYQASATFNAWVKLTIAGVHALRAPPNSGEQAISGLGNFADQYQIFYHQNHPVRFVRVVGTVIAIEDISSRFALLTLDDGSGATIEVKITRRLPDVPSDGKRYSDPAAPLSPECPSNTTVDNVEIVSEIGVFAVLIDGHAVDIGTVLKTKCTLTAFRNTHQLMLQRVAVVRNTAEEAACWADTAAYYAAVLARPWHLTDEKVAALDKKLRREERKRKDEERLYEKKVAERQRRKDQWRKEVAEKTRVADEKMERNRRKEELIMNKGALI